MFAKHKVAYTPQYPVRHLCAQSGKLTMILVNSIMLRIDTQTPDIVNGWFDLHNSSTDLVSSNPVFI